MQTRSRAKKQKLGHDPSDPEDSPTGRLRKNAALKAQSAQKSARSAEICPWGPQGRITTDRGTPRDHQTKQRSPEDQQDLQTAQRNFDLASSMDLERIRQLETERDAALARTAEGEAREAALRQDVADLRSLTDLCKWRLATRWDFGTGMPRRTGPGTAFDETTQTDSMEPSPAQPSPAQPSPAQLTAQPTAKQHGAEDHRP
jgi:hypothetical protein